MHNVEFKTYQIGFRRGLTIYSNNTIPSYYRGVHRNECRGILTRADALADDVPVCAAADHIYLLLHQDVLELLPHFSHLAHRLDVNEVLVSPAC